MLKKIWIHGSQYGYIIWNMHLEIGLQRGKTFSVHFWKHLRIFGNFPGFFWKILETFWKFTRNVLPLLQTYLETRQMNENSVIIYSPSSSKPEEYKRLKEDLFFVCLLFSPHSECQCPMYIVFGPHFQTTAFYRRKSHRFGTTWGCMMHEHIQVFAKISGQ